MMDSKAKKILIWGSSVCALVLILLILLVVSGVFAGKVTYLVDGEVYAETSGASVGNFSLPDDPEKEGYSFGGWYTDEKFEESFELNKIGFLGFYFGNTKVYAQFDKHVHTFETRETTKPTCLNTGVKIKVCKDPDCNFIQSTEVVPAKGHDASGATINPHFNDDGSIRRFSFDGKCSVCKADLSLRNVTADVKSEEVIKADCQADGEIRYTYKAYGKSFTYRHVVEKKEHTLNGKPISEFYVYDEYVRFGTEGVHLNQTVTSKPVCTTTFSGKYVCEECNKYFDVLVMQPHNDTVDVVEPANCDTDGREVHSCKTCGSIRFVDIPALGHSKFYYLTMVKSNGSFMINCDCAREDCDYVFEEETEKADMQFVASSLLAYATCGDYGRILHSYNDGDLDISFLELTARLPHTLNGVSVDNFTYSDGSFRFGIPGVKLFAGRTAPKCGERTEDDYYFICEKCEQITPVTVDRRHDYSSSVTLKPTCTADGVREYSCTTCDYSYTESIPKLDHVAVFKNGERVEVYKKDDEGHIIYTFQEGIALPDGYVPKNGEIVKGVYVCDGCKKFTEADVIIRLAK